MAIPSRGIGWGTEENLLWQISKQIERLTCVTAGGCGSITTTTTTTLPVYRVYTALLTQTGTDAPVATVLQNTLEGTISFHYSGEGNYVVVNSIPWDQSKTTFQLEQGFSDFGSFVPSFVPITGGGKTFLTFSNTGTAGSLPPNILPPSNGVLNKSLVEIKVYN